MYGRRLAEVFEGVVAGMAAEKRNGNSAKESSALLRGGGGPSQHQLQHQRQLDADTEPVDDDATECSSVLVAKDVRGASKADVQTDLVVNIHHGVFTEHLHDAAEFTGASDLKGASASTVELYDASGDSGGGGGDSGGSSSSSASYLGSV